MLKRLAVAVLLVATACASGPAPRTIFVDFASNDFNSMFLRFFPTRIQAHPGDVLSFRQVWTGEAHTVTGGTIADDVGALVEQVTGKSGEIAPFEYTPEIGRVLEKF